MAQENFLEFIGDLENEYLLDFLIEKRMIYDEMKCFNPS